MDIRQTIFDTAASLRDFVEYIMKNQMGEDWIDRCGLGEERLDQLREIKEYWDNQRSSLQEENRLANFLEFPDILKVIKTHYEGDFELAFGDIDITSAYLRVLGKFSDPDSHNRMLLVHQKHLVLGISGALRNRMVAYRSIKEKGKRGFPMIESVRDSLGHIWVPTKPTKIHTGMTLQVGDVIEFVVAAKDPEDQELQYKLYPDKWTSSSVLIVELNDSHIGKDVNIHIAIKSERKDHAYPMGYDDRVTFVYDIIGKR